MELTEKKKNGIFITILVSNIACGMLSTALTTALPQMMKDFGINSSTGQWMTSIYSLVMGIFTLAAPFVMKRISTRKLYLGLLALFMGGLLLSGCTSSFAVMMAGRVLQAAANGVMVALGQVMILTVFPAEKRGSVMGIYGLAIGAAPVVAPTLAGIIVDLFGWRMIFFAVLAVTVISFVMAFVTFADALETAAAKLDILSLGLCSVGVCGLLLGAGNLGNSPFLSVSVLLPLVVGAIASWAFAHRQLTMEDPFMELRILKVRKYRTAVIASMILYSTVIASSILLPLYIQSVRGYSATVSALVTMPGALATALVSPVSGKLYDKSGMKRLFFWGALMLVISNGGMIFVSEQFPLLLIGVLNVIRCIGIGCLMMPLVTWGMSGLEQKYTSHGTALLTSLRTVAGSFGSAVFVAVVNVVASAVEKSVAGAAGSGAAEEAASLAAQSTGMSVAFVGLTAIAVAELLLGLWTFRKNSQTR